LTLPSWGKNIALCACAEFVFRDFFKKHPASDLTSFTRVIQRRAAICYRRYLGTGESYNVFDPFKNVEGANLIHEINFVKE